MVGSQRPRERKMTRAVPTRGSGRARTRAGGRARIADGGRGSRGAARAVGAIRQQAAGDRRRGRDRRGRVQDRRRMDRPPGRLTAPATCPGSRQLLARAPARAAGATCPGSPPGIAAGGRGRPRPEGQASRGAAGAAGDRRPQRGSMFLFHSAPIVSAGDRGRRVQGQQAAGDRRRGPWPRPGGSGPPDGSRQAAWAARVQGGRIISAGAAGRRGRGRVQGAAGRRMDRGRQQGPPVSRGPDYFSGAAGRRGRVHFDGRQGRGAPGRRGRDRAHAYTREHKTRVRPLPLKKIFLFPVGEYLARKTGVFPHGPFFCAMLFTSQGKRPAGDGGKPPKKFPEKNF